MIEITSKNPAFEQNLPSWRWLLWVSIAVLVIVVLAYFGLRFYLIQLHNQAADLNNRIKTAAALVNPQDEETIIRFNNSLDSLSSLFKNHTYFSNFFNLIGSLTYPKISYRSFQADAVKNNFQVQGAAQSYSALAKQIVAFRNNPFVKGVDISGIVFGPTGLQFNLKIDVQPEIFRQAK